MIPNKKKVLFLDIDGILSNKEYYLSDYFQYRKKYSKAEEIDDRTLPLLREIVKQTHCKIVLSSSWRYLFFEKKFWHRIKPVVKEFKKYGIVIKDRTGFENGKQGIYFGRGLQIKKWLDRHSEVKHFAILDDDSYDLKMFGDKLVKTNWCGEKSGLQQEHVNKCIELLNGKVL